MCGICGFSGPRPGDWDARSTLQAMCDTITYRGPDDQGTFIADKVGLGARRLSILDVEGGHQPLSNEDGSSWAVHNGEVYNFLELRQELQGKGHCFSTRTDTETVLHAYLEWGMDFGRRLRGMFATAIWDDSQKKLVLIRDRMGIKPLYYTQLPDGALVFGSELKTILAYPGIDRTLEPQALDYFLTLEYIPAPYSIIKNIFKLPPGSILEYQAGTFKISTYWELEPPTVLSGGLGKNHLNERMDELYALLKESVQLRLISDVPLGSFLSGGIDSSAIVGIMRELGASPLKTFSIGFEDQTYNELGHARRVADRFSTEHEEFVLQPQALQLTEKLVRHLDEPLGDFSIFPTYLVSQMARQHVTVALSGDGGDELFGGYEHYQAQKLAQMPWMAPFHATLPPLVRRLPPSSKKKGLWNKLQRYCQGLEHGPDLRHFRWMMFLSLQEKQRLYSDTLVSQLSGLEPLNMRSPFSEAFAQMADYDAPSAEMFLDLKTYLVDNILVKVDRMSMAASLETRVPLLDHKIVEFAFRLPGELKLRGKTTKWIFKKTLERLLPKETIYRRKEGFSIPIKHWLRHELKDLMLDYLSENRIREAGHFNYPAVHSLIASHVSGKANHSHQLWSLLVFEIWREHYLS